MKSRLTLIILTILAVPLGVRGQDASPAQLLDRAKQAGRRARAGLAGVRREHVEQRKALTVKLNEAYKQLDAAQEAAESAAGKLKESKTRHEQLRRDSAKNHRLIHSLLLQAASASGEKLDPQISVANMEKIIWGGLESQLQSIALNANVTVQVRSIVGRDGETQDAPVVQLGAWAQYACGPAQSTAGLLKTVGEGRMLVAGPLLSLQQRQALQALAEGRGSHLPIDPSQTLQDRKEAKAKDFMGWLDTGGIFIYPILISGLLGLILIIERVFYLASSKAPQSLAGNVLVRMESGDMPGAMGLIEQSNTPTARVLKAWLESAGQSRELSQGAVESALLMEAGRLERSFSLIAALAGAAPLLGLLGTVSGMIATFDTISSVGTGNPQLMSGGISEALITTQLGLMVAIPLLLAHAWLRRWTQRREAMLEYNAMQVLGGQGKEGAL
jgi:biopolymer transport protein ExbB/TolQ